MELKDYARKQVEDALGPVNRWYCSEFHGREITDPNTLIEYYIKHGGAEYFAKCDPNKQRRLRPMMAGQL